MRARLLFGFLAFATIVALGLEVPIGISLANNQRSSAVTALERDGTSLSVLLSEALERGDTPGATQVAETFARSNGIGVAVVSGGRVNIASSPALNEELDDLGIPAIVRSAAHGRVGGVDPAGDGDDEQLYAALPLGAEAPTSVGAPTAPADVLLLTTSAGSPVVGGG